MINLGNVTKTIGILLQINEYNNNKSKRNKTKDMLVIIAKIIAKIKLRVNNT